MNEWIDTIASEVYEMQEPPSPKPMYQFELPVKDFMDKYRVFDEKRINYCTKGSVYEGLWIEKNLKVAVKQVNVVTEEEIMICNVTILCFFFYFRLFLRQMV